jgi:hypothetical protein
MAVAGLTPALALVAEFLTTDADGVGVTDELGLFIPVADARRPSPVFFMLEKVCTVSAGSL